MPQSRRTAAATSYRIIGSTSVCPSFASSFQKPGIMPRVFLRPNQTRPRGPAGAGEPLALWEAHRSEDGEKTPQKRTSATGRASETGGQEEAPDLQPLEARDLERGRESLSSSASARQEREVQEKGRPARVSQRSRGFATRLPHVTHSGRVLRIHPIVADAPRGRHRITPVGLRRGGYE